MIAMPKRYNGIFLLSPFILFVSFFIISTMFLSSKMSPIFACIIAIIYSMFTFSKKLKLNEKISIFVKGSSHPTVIIMCYIYIFISVFNYILRLIGGIDSAVSIGLYAIPGNYILPGFFSIVSLFALATGTSVGAIAAFLPVGIGISKKVGINPSMMAGLVVGGAMLGDNLSIISDTTIAATQSVGAKMVDKFKENVWLVTPAFILTSITLTLINFFYLNIQYHEQIALNKTNFILITPYIAVFSMALCGIDVIAVLISSIFLAIGIGVFQNTFSLLSATQLILEGFSNNEGGVHGVLLLAMLVAGLSKIVEFNGGITYILEKFSSKIKTTFGAEVSIAILTILINTSVAINAVAILVTGPVAKQIASKFGIEPKRTACLLDLFACICQGIIPYAPPLLLAGIIANVPSTSIIPYLYYQGFIFLVASISILKKYNHKPQQLKIGRLNKYEDTRRQVFNTTESTASTKEKIKDKEAQI
jgi:Na+/H+ antiporter NhaC